MVARRELCIYSAFQLSLEDLEYDDPFHFDSFPDAFLVPQYQIALAM
jgi:hypothetical protein